MRITPLNGGSEKCAPLGEGVPVRPCAGTHHTLFPQLKSATRNTRNDTAGTANTTASLYLM